MNTTPWFWQNCGLLWFCLVSFSTPLVLLYDRWLGETGREMITTYCRANPWAAFCLLLLIGSGLCGLSVHFMTPFGLTVGEK